MNGRPRNAAADQQHANHLNQHRVATVASERWIWVAITLIALIAVAGATTAVIGFERELD